MHDDVELSHTIGRVNVPLLRGRLNQHEPRGSAGLPHDIIKASDRMRSIGVLIAVARIADGLVDLHLLPIGVQLVSNDERERSANAGAHLRTMSDNPYGAVRINPDKHI